MNKFGYLEFNNKSLKNQEKVSLDFEFQIPITLSNCNKLAMEHGTLKNVNNF